MYAYKGLEDLAKMVSEQYSIYSRILLEDEIDLLCEAGKQDIPTFVYACKVVCGTKLQPILLSAAKEVVCMGKWYISHAPTEDDWHQLYLSALVAIDQYHAMRCLTHIARIYFPQIHKECYCMALKVRAYALFACDCYRRYEIQSRRSA